MASGISLHICNANTVNIFAVQAGAKLLAADVRISLRLVFKVARGHALSR